MVDRTSSVEKFAFSEETKGNLSMNFKTNDPQKIQKLIAISEWHVRWYLHEKKSLDSDPIATAAGQKKEVDNFENILGALNSALESLDGLGWQTHLDFELWKRRQNDPAGFLLEFQKEVFLLRNCLPGVKEHLATPKPGSPGRTHQTSLVAAIVNSYREIFGKLPPKGRETPFQGFITEIFWAIGEDYEDCSRIVNNAILYVYELGKDQTT